MPLPRFVSAPHVQRGRAELALLPVLVALLELAAGTGLAYVPSAGHAGSFGHAARYPRPR